MEKTIRQQVLAGKYQQLLAQCLLSNPVSAKMAFDAQNTESDVMLAALPYSSIKDTEVQVSDADIKELYAKLDKLQDGDVLVLAGSIPSVMPSSMYMDIMKHLSDKKLDIVVDATNDLLVNVLQYHPFLIKPNNHELGEIFGVELNTRDEVVPYAKKMQEIGARNVLISMAGEGAVLVTEDGQVFQSEPPKGTLMNSVGAGDSMVAGFIAGYLDSKDYEQAFYMGVCTGSASAFSEELATKDGVSALLKQLGKAYL
jgi:1-phosphofructokinase